ncbi:MAG: ExbD/TolR family protein [Chitinophagaceae bacterium]
MAAIDTIIERRRGGMRHPKKHMPKTDMTPMVDLGFLLISFFVITTELNKPATIDLNMPKEGPPIVLGESDALTVLLGKDNTVYYYHGGWDKAIKTSNVFQTNLSVKYGVGKLIREKQHQLDVSNLIDGRKGLMLLIKPGKDAVYSNVIDMLDEAIINDVKKYAVLKQEDEEIKYLAAPARKEQ